MKVVEFKFKMTNEEILEFINQTGFIQSIVLLETFIFTIYISTILFNLFTKKTTKEKNINDT